MMYAVGLPGQMPRVWVETDDERQAGAQLLAGEILSSAVEIGPDGRPVAEPLPAST